MHYTRTWHTGALSALCTMHHIHAQWCTSSPCTITVCTCTHCQCSLNIADGCLDPREGPPKKHLVKSRGNRSRKSRLDIFDPPFSPIAPRSLRNPMLSRFSESAAEKLPSARCNETKRRCAVSKHLHFPTLHSTLQNLSRNVPSSQNKSPVTDR
jgi:hypothetical protein